jgi:hypothetical protein
MTRDIARRLREADELLKFGDDLDSIGDLLSEAASLIETMGTEWKAFSDFAWRSINDERMDAVGEPNPFHQDALQLPDIEHRMPSNLFKWLATIDAHAKGCLEDGGAGSLDAMACIRHNVRHLIDELRPLYAAPVSPVKEVAEPSPSGEAVAVKPLEWVDMGEGPRCITVCGMYAIQPSSGAYGRPTLTLTGMPGNLFGKFDTLEAAKARAFADYAKRILSALYTHPAPPSGIVEALKDFEQWCLSAREKLGAIDGYDYRSGEEYGLRRAELEAHRRICALLSQPKTGGAHPAPSVVEDWRPIESAPKDGTTVLIGRDMGEPWGFVRGYGHWEGFRGIEGWLAYPIFEIPGVLGLGNPTHWTPIPAPPAKIDAALALQAKGEGL